jgi:hypothetical protein
VGEDEATATTEVAVAVTKFDHIDTLWSRTIIDIYEYERGWREVSRSERQGWRGRGRTARREEGRWRRRWRSI